MITFPASGDDRAVQHIPRIRKFVADLHKRMPYFPMFLNLDPRIGMRMVYFGCLADMEATRSNPDGSVRTDALHPSLLEATKSSIRGIQQACRLIQIDEAPFVEKILEPYDQSHRRWLL
jgi:hypothetical protein